MNHQEKSVWLELVANLVVLVGYSAWLLSELGKSDLDQIDYKWVLVSVFLFHILFSMITQIILAIVYHRSANLVDIRDKDISRRSNALGMSITSAVALVGLGLALFEMPYFAIVHALFYGGLVASLAINTAKLRYYRVGV